MPDPLSSLTALLLHRARLLAAFKREGVKRVSIEGSTNDREAYLKLEFPRDEGSREARTARLQKALRRLMPLAKPTWDGVVFPLLDLRGNRAEAHAERILAAFPRYRAGRAAPVLVVSA